jgi:hypothetical protein
MKKITLLLVLLFCIWHLTDAQVSEKDTIDPMLGNYIMGSNSELILLSSFKSGNFSNGVFEFQGDSIQLKNSDNMSVSSSDISAITGDFSGDNADDLVFAARYSNRSVFLAIRSSNNTGFSWSTKKDTILSGGLRIDTSYHVHSLKKIINPSIRLISCNMDKDPQKEFILAYLGANDNVNFLLFDVDSHFKLTKISEVTNCPIYSAALYDPVMFDIVAADFDQDDLDEIVIINPWGRYGNGQNIFQFHSYVTIFDYNPLNKIFDRTFSLGPIVSTIVVQNKATASVLSFYNLAATTGDINGDGIKEVVYSYVFAGNYSDKTYDKIFNRFNAFSVKKDLTGIQSILPTTDSPCIDDDYLDYSKSGLYPTNLKAADLSGNGKAEIIAYAGRKLRIFEMNAANTDVVQKAEYAGFNIQNINYRSMMDVSDVDADTSQSLWIPEIVLLNPELKNVQKYEPVVDIPNNLVTSIKFITQKVTGWAVDNSSAALVLGDFDGDGIHLGAPVHLAKKGILMPIVILNAPPYHFDVLNGKIYDISDKYPFDDRFYTFYSSYSTSQETTAQTTSSSKHSFGVSAEYSKGVGVGKAGFTCSLKAKFGMDFENKSDNITKLFIKEETNAYDDQVYGKWMTYHLFEYPFYYKGKKSGSFLVSIPNEERSQTWENTKSIFNNLVTLNHEPGNLLSYPSLESINEIPDIAPDINDTLTTSFQLTNKQVFETSNYTWNISISEAKLHSFTKSYNVGASVDAGYKGLVNSFSLHGDYSYSHMAFSSTNITDGLDIKGHMGRTRTDVDADFYLNPIVYWSKTGALVVDYIVDLEKNSPGDWWDNYGKNSDPAFIMPFRYEKEKGVTLTYGSKKILTSDIRYFPYDAHPGEEIEIEITVRNFSLKNCDKDVKVKVYLGDPDCGGSPITIGSTGSNELNYGKITARGLKIKSFYYKTPSIINKPWIFAVIDSTGQKEIHLNNNKAFIRLFTDRYPGDSEWRGYEDINVGIKNYKKNEIKLSNYPNPAKNTTTIQFSMKESCLVMLSVYNNLGQIIEQRFVNSSPGMNYVQLDVSSYPQGVYMNRLTAGNAIVTEKMIIE